MLFKLKKKSVLCNILIVTLLSIIVVGVYLGKVYNIDTKYYKEYNAHDVIVRRFLEQRESWTTSNVGSLLFKFQFANDIMQNNTRGRENKRFIVLIWKHWDWLKNRHIYSFDNERLSEPDPLEQCSVRNCLLTGDDKYLESADAVVVHIQHGVFPNTSTRNNRQRWIFLNDESPINAFSMAKVKPKLEDLKNIFNWSMTYRIDADIPVPYGRTVPLQQPILGDITIKSLSELVPNWHIKRRDKLASILVSNCGPSKRLEYLHELENYLPLDVHGKCSKDHKNSCPGHFKADCKVTGQYLFYLVFENSQCREYITEKVFNNAYEKGAIPVIMGPKNDDCAKILPPNSFLHVDNFNGPDNLADYIKFLSENEHIMLEYHRWRNDFKIVSEHGYFGTKSFHYCRVCEALNYNDRNDKVYSENELRSFLDPALLCS
ncbi:unnamed protein product [Pieris macdunnoughi]|uniref:Fucosyltransferase n=1 Tax=Pieris macdunnoughi TaxID=345717 RepID=A0A821RT12_9NEOP|nr:unnamed protein product [Pieris macdunnoughi]